MYKIFLHYQYIIIKFFLCSIIKLDRRNIYIYIKEVIPLFFFVIEVIPLKRILLAVVFPERFCSCFFLSLIWPKMRTKIVKEMLIYQFELSKLYLEMKFFTFLFCFGFILLYITFIKIINILDYILM